MSIERIKICNARIITPYRVIGNGCIITDNGRIEKVSDNDIRASDCIVIDAGGRTASPGFVDIHTHGGGGHDFMDATAEAFLGAAEAHARHGTTSMVPTTLTSSTEELKETFSVYKAAKRSNVRGSDFLGLHLEGPYFSKEQLGAQDPKYIKDPDPDEYLKILDSSDDIVRWSAAPELNGAMGFGRELRSRGILASVAHSNAVCERVIEAFENGYRHITHLYSAMSGVRRINAYRYAGVIESAYLIDEMTVEIIADGSHLPASLLKMIYKIKGADKVALVTDSMRAAGSDAAESILGSLRNGQKVIIEDGVAKLPDRTAFAGSVATADRLVRTMTETAGVPLTDAVRMMTATPAGIIGADKTKGSLTEGKDADIVIFDEGINISMTMIKGRIVYSSKEFNERRR
jgi:N-acetylglucosamine-6-phosphate deacetylase